MTDRDAAGAMATERRPVAAAAPFSRPTPADAGRATPCPRPSPFVAPHEPAPEADPIAATEGGGDGAAPSIGEAATAAEGAPFVPEPTAEIAAVAAMTWPAAAELDAAYALDALARRLRDGSLRLPVAVDPASPAAVLVALLAALHADGRAGGAGPEPTR